MTSANAINCVVSRLRSVPRKPLNINLSLLFQKVGSGEPKASKHLSDKGKGYKEAIDVTKKALLIYIGENEMYNQTKEVK